MRVGLNGHLNAGLVLVEVCEHEYCLCRSCRPSESIPSPCDKASKLISTTILVQMSFSNIAAVLMIWLPMESQDRYPLYYCFYVNTREVAVNCLVMSGPFKLPRVLANIGAPKRPCLLFIVRSKDG